MARFSYSASMALVAGQGVASVDSGGTSAARIRVYDIVISSASGPADAAAKYIVERKTAAGTHTDGTSDIASLDPADPTSVNAASHTYTSTQPATQDTMLTASVNQRATFRWVAAPGSELICPATADNGIILTCSSVTTQFTADVTFMWEE